MKETTGRKKVYMELESERIRQEVEGKTIITNQGYEVRLNKYYSCFNCELEFLNVKFPYTVNIGFKSFKKKTVRYPYHPTKFNVGYIGEGKYKSTGEDGGDLPVYRYWDGIMRRCYSERLKNTSKTYADCSVDERWHNFQNFAEWFYENYDSDTMERWCLDKDVIVKGNRIYSPETCCFIPNEINILFTNGYVRRGLYPKGVTYKKKINRYIAQYKDEGIVTHIGTYKTIEEAFQAYKKVKEDYIRKKADKWKGLINSRVYEAMYNYKVEITD